MHERRQRPHQWPVYPCAYREHALSRLTNIPAERFIPVHTGNIQIIDEFEGEKSVYPCAYREHTNYNILFYN